MSGEADLIDWQFDPSHRHGIHEARKELIVSLFNDPNTATSVLEMIQPPVNTEVLYRVAGALTLIREGFIEPDTETQVLKLTDHGVRFANGILALSHG